MNSYRRYLNNGLNPDLRDLNPGFSLFLELADEPRLHAQDKSVIVVIEHLAFLCHKFKIQNSKRTRSTLTKESKLKVQQIRLLFLKVQKQNVKNVCLLL